MRGLVLFRLHPDVALFAQIKGIVVIGAFTFFSSLAVWGLLKYTVGIRVIEEDEYNGVAVNEFGLHAYPEFDERQGSLSFLSVIFIV